MLFIEINNNHKNWVWWHLNHWMSLRIKMSGECKDTWLKKQTNKSQLPVAAPCLMLESSEWAPTYINNHIIQNSKTNYSVHCSHCHTLETIFSPVEEPCIVA